jgi:hypothetical protein
MKCICHPAFTHQFRDQFMVPEQSATPNQELRDFNEAKSEDGCAYWVLEWLTNPVPAVILWFSERILDDPLTEAIVADWPNMEYYFQLVYRIIVPILPFYLVPFNRTYRRKTNNCSFWLLPTCWALSDWVEPRRRLQTGCATLWYLRRSSPSSL